MSARHPDLAWLRSVLWPDEGLVRVVFGGPSQPGFRRTGAFAILPNTRRPRLLVPLTSRQASRVSLWQFNAGMTQRARLTKALAGAAFAVGLDRVLVRDRLFIDTANHLPEEDLDAILPERRLAAILQRPGTAVAVTFGSLRPNRKPVLQAITPDGSTLAYAKVAWNELTLALVRNEATTLRRWALKPPRTFAVPALIHQGTWGDREMTVISAFPHRVLRKGRLSQVPTAHVVREISSLGGITSMKLRETPMWEDVRKRIFAASSTLGGRPAETALRFERDFGDVQLEVGTWHGDWAPWNMSQADGRLNLWDWERSRDGAPVGLDVAHFGHQVALGRVEHDHVEAARRAGNLVGPLLRDLGIDSGRWPAILGFYLFELFLRYEEATSEGVLDADDPARAAILSAIEWTAWRRR